MHWVHALNCRVKYVRKIKRTAAVAAVPVRVPADEIHRPFFPTCNLNRPSVHGQSSRGRLKKLRPSDDRAKADDRTGVVFSPINGPDSLMGI